MNHGNPLAFTEVEREKIIRLETAFKQFQGVFSASIKHFKSELQNAQEPNRKKVVEQSIAQHERDFLEHLADTLTKLNVFIPAGRYVHFKSTPENPKHYTVHRVSNHTETGEFTVVYTAHYGPLKGHMGNRPLSGPNGFVIPKDVSGILVERFRRLPQLV